MELHPNMRREHLPAGRGGDHANSTVLTALLVGLVVMIVSTRSMGQAGRAAEWVRVGSQVAPCFAGVQL